MLGIAMQDEDFRLELKIEPTDYGACRRVRSSPVGPVSAPFELTVTRRELDELWASLRSAAQPMRLTGIAARAVAGLGRSSV